jgi:hypothetical protein
MPIHDYFIDNGTGANVRADINAALSAIVSLNSNPTEPGTMYAYQLWADTTSNLLKIRNSGNSAWITLRQLDGDFSIVAVEDGLQATPSLTFTNDLNTGVFRSGTDALAIVTGGQYAITCSSTQAVGIKTANPQGALQVAGSTRIGANDVTDAFLEIGEGATGNRNSYIDIVGDTTYTDYGLRVIRNNTGANATSELKHRGTGALNFTTEEAAPIVFYTTNSPSMTITSGGLVGIGTSSPSNKLTIYDAAANPLRLIQDHGTSSAYGLEFYSAASTPYIVSSLTASHGAAYVNPYLDINVSDTSRVLQPRVRIDASGRVGIGNTGPSVALEIGAATGAAQVDANVLRVNRSVTGQYATFSSASGAATINGVNGSGGAIVFQGDGNPRAQIDGSGRLLVGTSTDSGPVALVEVAVGGQNAAQFGRYTSSSTPAYVLLTKSRSDTKGAHTVVQNNDGMGALSFLGSDGTAFVEGARIEAQVDGTPGANDMPGRLVFSTTADGGSSPTERVRITSTGQVRLAGAGITFNGDTAAANELDDYEEGTWTPVVTGWTSVTYTFQEGKYIKIGKHLTAWFLIQFSGTSAATAVTITGLPFTGETSSHGGSLTYYNAPLNETSGALIYPDAGTISFYADSDAASVLQSNGNASGAYLVGSINSIRS